MSTKELEAAAVNLIRSAELRGWMRALDAVQEAFDECVSLDSLLSGFDVMSALIIANLKKQAEENKHAG